LDEDSFLLCGIDEAGRGPLAGPVCAAAVILPSGFPVGVLNDSKRLKAGERERARLAICESNAKWGIGWASAAEIDEINIHRASLLSMKRAFEAMIDKGIHNNIHEMSKIRAIVDGLFVPDINVSCQALVKADNSVPEVMAASILAKTARDRLMEYYGLSYTQYGYEKHKGYSTKAHREAILRFGPSPIQRMSFRVKLYSIYATSDY
jgi:ribonuclease HII